MGFLKPKRPDTSAADKAIETDLELQKEQFEYAKQIQEPFLETGLSGQQALSYLLGTGDREVGSPISEQGLDYGSLIQPFSRENFEATPGYGFRRDEGERAINRAAAARGQYNDPSTVRALGDYNQNMASNEYLNSYNRYNTDQSNLYNRLAGLAGVGQQAGQQLMGAGQNFAAGSSNAVNNYANVKGAAAQQLGSRNSSMWQSLLPAAAQVGAAAFSDERLKKDIKKIDNVDGINVYEFRYKDDAENKLYSGVMAQEIQEDYPDAIHADEDSGMMSVDYSLLPVDFKEIKKCH